MRSNRFTLYHITHVDNLESIMKHGILSKRLLQELNISPTLVLNEKKIKNKKTPHGRSVDPILRPMDFVNFFFQPKNPLLYRLVKENKKIIVLEISFDIDSPGIYVSDGDITNKKTKWFSSLDVNNEIVNINKVSIMDGWLYNQDDKRKIMSECKIPDIVMPSHIRSIYASNDDMVNKIKSLIESSLTVIHKPSMFFKPMRKITLTKKLSLVEGDIFFSDCQTITITVNCVGIMGKGIALQAKNLVPSLYVHYQELCRNNAMRVGAPYLEDDDEITSFYHSDIKTIADKKTKKSFLLFPTKDHWKSKSSVVEIEKGLIWLVKNYKRIGIKSLAISALGCGNGGLEWEQVGPLMCRYLSELNIDVELYLPSPIIPSRYLNKDFLLSAKNFNPPHEDFKITDFDYELISKHNLNHN